MNTNTFYPFQQRYTTQPEFLTILQSLTPTIESLLKSINPKLKNTILNYRDLQSLFIKYELNPYKLSLESLKIVNNMISSNVDNYINSTPSLNKIIFDYIPAELTIDQKISLSLEIILSMTNIASRNQYIQKFIKHFTRHHINDESSLWLYNIYTNGSKGYFYK